MRVDIGVRVRFFFHLVTSAVFVVLALFLFWWVIKMWMSEGC